MPRFDRDVVRELVVNKNIKAFTFDTNIVDSFARSGNLRHPMLKSIATLNGKDVAVILSEVVSREAQKHYVEAMMEAYKDAVSSMNKLVKVGGKTQENFIAATAALPSVPEHEASLQDEFAAFLLMLNAQIVLADDYALFSTILDQYFQGLPPFANAKKKAEFPDAIAISTLQEWSDQEGAVIAVSNDGDWITAFEASENVHIVQNLHTALAIFQEDDKLAGAFAEHFRKSDKDVLLALSGAIEDSLSDFDVELVFETDWQVDLEMTEASLNSFSAPEDFVLPEIVGADAETVTIVVPVEAKITVVALATFSVSDPIDGDDVTIGSHDVAAEVDHHYLVSVTLFSNADGLIDVAEASVLPDTRLDSVDFEYVGFSPDADYYE